MKGGSKRFTNLYTGRAAIILGLITCGYWVLTSTMNVYTYAVVGAIYELLWLFMIALLFLVPIASIIALILDKFKDVYFYLLSIILTIGTYIWLNYFL